jgi:hypothetical protein
MKKLTLLGLLFWAGIAPVFSQSSITSIAYNKTKLPALMLELPYNQNISQDFIVANLKKTGYDPETKGKLFWKQNKQNGYYIFKGVLFEGLKQTVDLYFRVEQRSSLEKDRSIIYLLLSRGDENFITSATDEQAYKAATKFMNGFVSQSAAYKLDLEIKAQEDAIREAENKLAALQENERTLNKKLEQLQAEQKKNKTEIEDQQKAIGIEKRKLETLKASSSQ